MAAIVPMVSSHLRYLPRLLKNLGASTLPFDEIVIVASGFRDAELMKLENELARNKNQGIRLVKTVLSPAGTNRNAGWNEVAARYIAFVDADDLYRKDRIEILLDVLKSENAAAVVHDYVRFRNSLFANTALVYSRVLEMTLRRLEVSAQKVATDERNTKNSNVSIKRKLHHAHVLVDRMRIDDVVRFSDTSARNEDALFLRAIQDAGGDIYFCNAKLSAYFLGSRVRKFLAKLVR